MLGLLTSVEIETSGKCSSQVATFSATLPLDGCIVRRIYKQNNIKKSPRVTCHVICNLPRWCQRGSEGVLILLTMVVANLEVKICFIKIILDLEKKEQKSVFLQLNIIIEL